MIKSGIFFKKPFFFDFVILQKAILGFNFLKNTNGKRKKCKRIFDRGPESHSN